jgi:hypothetical protein
MFTFRLKSSRCASCSDAAKKSVGTSLTVDGAGCGLVTDLLSDINWASERGINLQEQRQRQRLLEQFTMVELRKEKKEKKQVVEVPVSYFA